MSLEKEKVPLVQRCLEGLQNFWVIGILLLVFHFLDAVEQFVTLSNVLSLILEEWRSVLSAFWGLIINTCLRLFNIEPIVILSPWPEYATFLTMLIFTSFNKKNIEDTKIAKWLLGKNWAFREFYEKKVDFENFKIGSFLIFIICSYIGVMVLFLPYIAVGLILLTKALPLSFAMVLILCPVMLMISLADLKPSKYDTISETIELHGYVVIPIIIFSALLLVLTIYALEILAPGIAAFTERANVS